MNISCDHIKESNLAGQYESEACAIQLQQSSRISYDFEGGSGLTENQQEDEIEAKANQRVNRPSSLITKTDNKEH